MDYCISLSDLLEYIKSNRYNILDLIVENIIKDKDLRKIIESEIGKIEPIEPEDPIRQENGMVININLSREDVPEDDTFRLYLSGNGYVWIDWGDETLEEINLDTSEDDFYEHKYDAVGNNYTITVYGQKNLSSQRISFGSGDLFGNYYNRAIEEIETWGDLRLVSLSGALSYTTGPLTVPNKLPSTVTDLSYLLRESTVSEVINMQDWNTSNVTDMSWMFYSAKNFNGDISNWNTSNVKDMSHMFRGAESFNQDLIRDGDSWNTGNVENMSFMFADAKGFNGNISNWDTSKVNDMSHMFRGTENFNQDLSSWDTSSVENMSWMFYDTKAFNGNISSWDTSNVKDMSHMFREAESFNQDLRTNGNIWNTENVTDMSFMFRAAEKFNGDITNWDISKVEDMSSMFHGAVKFNQNISSWKPCSAEDMKDMFHNATDFDQNLSSWGVPNINPPTPSGFAINSPLMIIPSKHPRWGESCYN